MTCALHRVERSFIAGSQSDQTPRSLSGPGVLQETEHEALDCPTPRVIYCAEELPEHIALPRGCLPDAETLVHLLRALLAHDTGAGFGQDSGGNLSRRRATPKHVGSGPPQATA